MELSLALAAIVFLGWVVVDAFIQLGKRKGYTFVGTNSNGCNAFFVSNEYALLITQSLQEIKSYPSKFRESRNEQGQLTYLSGTARIKAIEHLPAYDCVSQMERPIKELGDLYTEAWQKK